MVHFDTKDEAPQAKPAKESPGRRQIQKFTIEPNWETKRAIRQGRLKTGVKVNDVKDLFDKLNGKR